MEHLQWREEYDKAAVQDAVRALHVDEAAKLVDSSSQQYAYVKFLIREYPPLVEAVRRLCQGTSLSDTSICSQNYYGATFQYGAVFGTSVDHVIIPMHDADVYIEDRKVDWNWQRPILFTRQTQLEIGNNKVVCIVFHFEREDGVSKALAALRALPAEALQEHKSEILSFCAEMQKLLKDDAATQIWTDIKTQVHWIPDQEPAFEITNSFFKGWKDRSIGLQFDKWERAKNITVPKVEDIVDTLLKGGNPRTINYSKSSPISLFIKEHGQDDKSKDDKLKNQINRGIKYLVLEKLLKRKLETLNRAVNSVSGVSALISLAPSKFLNTSYSNLPRFVDILCSSTSRIAVANNEKRRIQVVELILMISEWCDGARNQEFAQESQPRRRARTQQPVAGSKYPIFDYGPIPIAFFNGWNEDFLNGVPPQ
ncbi:hypothetical protein V8E54_013965 [Elaphomyces granulatus]